MNMCELLRAAVKKVDDYLDGQPVLPPGVNLVSKIVARDKVAVELLARATPVDERLLGTIQRYCGARVALMSELRHLAADLKRPIPDAA